MLPLHEAWRGSTHVAWLERWMKIYTPAWHILEHLYAHLCSLLKDLELVLFLLSKALKSNPEAWGGPLKEIEYCRREAVCPFLFRYSSLCLCELYITGAQQDTLWGHGWSLQTNRALPAGSYICPGILGAWRPCMNVHTYKNFLECFLGRDLAGTQVLHGYNPTQNKNSLGVSN